MKNLVLFLSLILLSCSSETNDNSLFSDGENTLTSEKTISPSNPSNNFDYVGAIHNDVVSEFVETYGEEDLSISEVLAEVENILLNNNDFLEVLDGSTYVGLTVSEIENGISDFSYGFVNIIDAQEISIEAKSKLDTLITTTLNYNLNYENYYDYVVSFEEEVLGSNLSNNEKEGILCVTSIARYSAYLWNNPNTQSRGGGNAWWIVGADVAGGIAGGILSGGGGILGGAAAGSSMASLILTNK